MFDYWSNGYFLTQGITVLLIFVIFSCKSESEIETTINEDILQASEIIAEPRLVISTSEELLIGDVADVKVLEDGSIVVLDDQKLSIHLLNEAGEFVNSYPFQGRGPGEVQNLSKRLRISPGNIIAIDDYFMRKISMFQVNDTEIEHIIDVDLESSVADFFLINKDHIVLKKSRIIEEEEPSDPIHLLNLKDREGEKVIRNFPAHKEITLSGASAGLNLSINTSTQYHATNEFCSSGSRLYHIRTDSLGLSIYDIEDGSEIFSVFYSQPARRLTSEEKELEVDRLLESGREFWGNGEKGRLLTEFPDYKPIAKRVICDLPNAIWLELMTEEEEKKWISLSDEGRIKGVFRKNIDGQLVSIHRENMFFLDTNDFGDLTLKTYRYSTKVGL